MGLIIVSTFWNSENYISECIKSVKNQYYTNFKAYFIDDMSTDNSYNIAKEEIGDDNRFTLIRNTEKKFKCKNFIDVIRNNEDIKWNDVIIELDGDDKLYDNNVLGLINKVYYNNSVWICGSKWVDSKGNNMGHGRMNADEARKTTWSFSHLRTYRAFLFRLIRDKDLKYNGEYFKAGVDIGIGLPMLEMSGNEHYHFLDVVTYQYNWHDHQSYSNLGAIQDSELQRNTAKYIYSLPKYDKLKVFDSNGDEVKYVIDEDEKNTPHNIVSEILGKINDKPFNPNKTNTIDYDKINRTINKNNPIKTNEIQKPKPNIPTDRRSVEQLRKDSLVSVAKKLQKIRPTTQNPSPHVFGGKTRQ